MNITDVVLRLLGKATCIRDFLRENYPSEDHTEEDGMVADLIRVHEGSATPKETEGDLFGLEKRMDMMLEKIARIEEGEWSDYGEDDYGEFGVCPHCKMDGGFIYVGGTNAWRFCRRHGLKWHIGPDLFADEFPEGEDDGDRRAFHTMRFGDFKEITLAEAGMDDELIQQMEERRRRMIEHKGA